MTTHYIFWWSSLAVSSTEVWTATGHEGRGATEGCGRQFLQDVEDVTAFTWGKPHKGEKFAQKVFK